MSALALLVGRFHALTCAQEAALVALGADPEVERIACVITSADHTGTRRNPLSAQTREAILRPPLEATGKPFDIIKINDIPDDARWAAYVAGAVGRAIGRTVDPAQTRYYTANHEVARLFAEAGFQVGLEPAPPLTPHELLQRIVDGQPWEDEASASTRAVYAAERVPQLLRAIFADRKRTDDGELAAKRDFDSYAGQMDAALAQKLEDMLPWVLPGKIVDKGCGTGKLMVELSRHFPRSAFVGVDLSREFLRRCDENTYASGDLELILGDAAAPSVAKGTASTVIYSSIMHEIYTYSGYAQAEVDRALASAAHELGQGGRVIIRDGVSPGKMPWRLKLLDAETAAQFERFAAEFKHGQGATHERVGADTVRLSAHFANEFLCKKDYQKNWHIEVHEEYGARTVDEWIASLEANGFEPVHLRAYVSPWIAEHRYRGKVELSDDLGQRLPWPATNVVVVGGAAMSAGNMGVAVDVAVFTVREGRLEVVLIQMKRPPFDGRWALPGGRIRSDETVEAAATRELAEKTGLDDVYLEQLYTFSQPKRDPQGRCVSVAHLALIPATASLETTKKYAAIAWTPADRPPKLAFDHAEVLAYAVKRLRAKLAYTNVAYSLLPPTFTLGELQRVYEAILGHPLDPRNFQRRIHAVGLVKETGQMRTGQAHRPARLFRFTERRPVELAGLA